MPDPIHIPSVAALKDFVEKPSVEDAPSNLAIAGRYVLTPDIFKYIEKTERGKNNEIQLTNAMAHHLEQGEAYHAVVTEGERYDIGIPTEYVRTIANLASQDSN